MKNTLIIGSVAAYHWFPNFREPKDIDILSKVIITKINNGSSNIELTWFELCEDIIAQNTDKVFATPDTLLTLKVSHAAWDIHHSKTMSDIFFLQKHAKLNKPLYKKLYDYWETVHGKKYINLNKDNTEFFTQYVKREYDHDWLHTQVSYPNHPMHYKIRPDKDSAYCSEKLWDELSSNDKLICAWEEMMVIAIERYNFLAAKKHSEIRISLSKAMHNLITSMTKGWFNLYLILNHVEIQRSVSLDELISLQERINLSHGNISQLLTISDPT
jgi:hypothetical protein